MKREHYFVAQTLWNDGFFFFVYVKRNSTLCHGVRTHTYSAPLCNVHFEILCENEEKRASSMQLYTRAVKRVLYFAYRCFTLCFQLNRSMTLWVATVNIAKRSTSQLSLTLSHTHTHRVCTRCRCTFSFLFSRKVKWLHEKLVLSVVPLFYGLKLVQCYTNCKEHTHCHSCIRSKLPRFDSIWCCSAVCMCVYTV